MILERIKQYIDFKGITIAAFERSIGMSNASFGKSLKKQGAIGTDKLENILMVYPDISPDWILTGQGNMLKSAEASPPQYSGTGEMIVSDEPVQYNTGPKETMVDKLLGIIDKKDNIIREQAEDIGHLRSELEQLKKRLQTSAATTSETAANSE